MNLELLLSLVAHNPKQRFQIALQAVPPLEDEDASVLGDASMYASASGSASVMASALGSARGPNSYIHFTIRACSGHSYQFIKTERLCARLTEESRIHISTLVHVTQRSNLMSIMRAGLRPGSNRVPGLHGHGRPHVYFATYLPEDPRFVTGKSTVTILPLCTTSIW